MNLASFFCGLALGAVGVGAAWMLTPTSPDAPSATTESGQAEVLDQLSEIQTSLRAIARGGEGMRLRGGEHGTSESQVSTGPSLEGTAASGLEVSDTEAGANELAPAALDANEAALERIVQRWEAKKDELKYAKLDNKALRAEASRLIYQEKNVVAARGALEALLKRPLDDTERVGALTELGASTARFRTSTAPPTCCAMRAALPATTPPRAHKRATNLCGPLRVPSNRRKH